MSIPQNEAELQAWLQVEAKSLLAQLPPKTGFVLLIFSEGDRLNYIANCPRAQVVRAMREFITMTQGQWGEHIGETDKDTELGQLRQRIEVLESKQKRLFESGFGYGQNPLFSLDEAWNAYLESVGSL